MKQSAGTHRGRFAAAAGLAMVTVLLAACGPGKEKKRRDQAQQTATPAPTPTAAAATPDRAALWRSEEIVRFRVSKAKSGLRSFQVAMEAYRVDFDTYPDQAYLLVTPIAYLSKFADDPFFDSSRPFAPRPGRPAPDPGPGFLKMAYAPDFSEIILYSVGPDGIDQRGEVEYDPEKGLMSEGDIVRRIELKHYCRFEDPGIQQKVGEQRAHLSAVQSAVEAWYQKNRALPDNLTALSQVAPNMQRVAMDVFSPGRPVSYRLGADKTSAILYSVGPDGDDDGGAKEIRGRFVFGQIPDGDLALKITLADLEEAYRVRTDTEIAKSDPMMKTLLELKERDGRDNALIHYVRANKRMPRLSERFHDRLIQDVLDRGWTESAEPLLPIMASFQPTLVEIRRGTAVDYAAGIGWDQGPKTPVLDFLSAWTAARILCVEGRYFVSKERYADALDNYMTALTMGRDYNAPGSMAIGGLNSIAIEAIALGPIYDIVRGGHLDTADLEKALARLKVIEKTMGTSAEALQGELHCMKWIFRKMRDDPVEAGKILKDSGHGGMKAPLVIAQVDRLEREYKQFWDAQSKFLETPCWERNHVAVRQEAEDMMASFHPLIIASVPNTIEFAARFAVTRAKIYLTQLATALSLYEQETGHVPQSLSELVPKYFVKLPVDPFSGQPFRYRGTIDGADYKLYSVGPDLKDDGGDLKYDPLKGTTSGGDLFFE